MRSKRTFCVVSCADGGENIATWVHASPALYSRFFEFASVKISLD